MAGRAAAFDGDVAVVGGGPVGLALGIAARARGLAVTVFEAAPAPPDKACGEGLMPDGVVALRALGIEPEALGRRFVGIRFLTPRTVAEARFAGGGVGCGIRRDALVAALLARARACGVGLRLGERVHGLLGRDGNHDEGDPRHVCGVVGEHGSYRSRFVVGADGLRSRVRRRLGLARGAPVHRGRFGIRQHFACAPWSDHVEVYWGDGVEAYVTPVGRPNEPPYVGVALLYQHPAASDPVAAETSSSSVAPVGRPAGAGALDSTVHPTVAALLARFPALRDRLAGTAACSRARGAGPFRQRVRRAACGRVALVGDAAGYVDAITGEGLGLGFSAAALLAAALAADDLDAYARAHRRLVRWPFALTELLLRLTRSPRLREGLLAALAARPTVFGELVASLEAHRPPRPAVLAGMVGGMLAAGARGR